MINSDEREWREQGYFSLMYLYLMFTFRDSHLNREEFSNLLHSLFTNQNESYTLTTKQEDEIFKLLDDNQVGTAILI